MVNPTPVITRLLSFWHCGVESKRGRIPAHGVLENRTGNEGRPIMKNPHVILAGLAAAMSIMINGCGSTIPVSSHRYPAVSVDSVQMLYQEPKRPYEVIALVGTEGGLTRFVADIAERPRGERIDQYTKRRNTNLHSSVCGRTWRVTTPLYKCDITTLRTQVAKPSNG
jgi:hypothetical protein